MKFFKKEKKDEQQPPAASTTSPAATVRVTSPSGPATGRASTSATPAAAVPVGCNKGM